MNRKTFFKSMCSAIAATAVALALPALAHTTPATTATPIPVVATFTILADMVRQVGGNRVAVTSLVGIDDDPHVYQPSPNDVRSIAHSKLVFMNGLELEGWMTRLVESSGYKGDIVVATKGITARAMSAEAEHEHEGHGHHHEADPHAWQDPIMGIIYVNNIVAGLSKLDPAGASEYRQRGEQYAAVLKTVHDETEKTIADVPPQKRKFITSHDAFSYFNARYGITGIAAQGITTETEPSARDISQLISQIRKEKIKALFLENMTNPRLVKQIGEEAGVKPEGQLFSDALSGPSGAAPDYISMLRYNAKVIAQGLHKN